MQQHLSNSRHRFPHPFMSIAQRWQTVLIEQASRIVCHDAVIAIDTSIAPVASSPASITAAAATTAITAATAA
jgi:hypothetical protein